MLDKKNVKSNVHQKNMKSACNQYTLLSLFDHEKFGSRGLCKKARLAGAVPKGA